MSKTKKYHFHLITGEIVFRHQKDENSQINAIRVNGVLADENRALPARLLGKAQQILQLNFHNHMQDASIEVLDVVLVNFSHLGEFTEAEFHATPEGTKLKQKDAEKGGQGPGLAVVGGSATLEEALAEAEAGANEENPSKE